MTILPFLEPFKLVGEGEYNLNALTEIKVTDNFLDLDQKVKSCQNEESFDNCTNRQYQKTFLDECGCLPLSIRSSNKVSAYHIIYLIKSHITYFKEPLCSSMELKCVEQIHVDTSSCLNPCSGLFVTSFSKLETSRKNFMSAAKRHDYAQYKKITPHPAGYDGNNIYT